MLTCGSPAEFPRFSALCPDWYDWYQECLFNLPQHCDFTLNNLLIWLAGDSVVECSTLSGGIVLRVSTSIYRSLRGTWLTYLGRHLDPGALRRLLEVAPGNRLLMVPDYSVGSMDVSGVRISEDEDNRDYILAVSGLVRMSGRRYERFRYQVRRFERQYGEEAVVRSLDLTDPTDAAVVLGGLVAWPKVNSFGPGGNDPARTDQRAIEQLIRLQPELSVKHRCLGVFIRERLRGFSIFHVPHARDRIGMGNHIKYDVSFDRMFDYLVYVTARDLQEQGVELLNAEQDLGIPGLRRHKTQLGPVDFYRKYTVAFA